MTVSAITSSSTPIRIGKVALTVRDLNFMTDFYRHVLGFEIIGGDGRTNQLGAGDTVLLELVADPQATQASPSEAGLFHNAFLLPTRADLGRWLNFVAKNRIRIHGASDHGVSEAIYLADPEGNGIEVYVDRPSSEWRYTDGHLQMSTDPLDIDAIRAVAGSDPWETLPSGSVIGHVHLQVGAIPEAEAFYADALGLELTARYPGGSFYGSGGYHHHLASNIWNSRGAGRRAQNSTGLRNVELLAADAAAFEAIAARLAKKALAIDTSADGLTVQDPWGTALTLRQRQKEI